MTHLYTDAAPWGAGANEPGGNAGRSGHVVGANNLVLIEQRLEELGLRALADIILEQQTQIAKQQRHVGTLLSQLTTQSLVLESLRDEVANLLASARLQPHLVGGRLPPMTEITRLKVQIFHSPNLNGDDRKAKTEWTLRLTVWVNGLRAAEEITCVKLYPGRRFAESVRNLTGEVPAKTKDTADAFADSDGQDFLIGMLQAKTARRGTPYIRDQFCYMQDHLSDDPAVLVVIGDTMIPIREFRPAAGTKSGHAKWWAEWVR